MEHPSMTDPTPTPNRPLWQVIYTAGRRDGDDGSIHPWEAKQIAAELRAIAKWVEECTVSTTAFGPNDMPVVWRIAGLLLAEADKAEAGE
jgi:G:T/U-mismatch repair DNA glycosylase